MTIDTQAQEYFSKHRRIWEQKPVLRRIYEEELFARLLSSKTPGGISIEIGGGPGFFKKLFPEVISTDLISCPWLEVLAGGGTHSGSGRPFGVGRALDYSFFPHYLSLLSPGRLRPFRATLEIGGSRHSPREKGLRWQSSNSLSFIWRWKPAENTCRASFFS